MFESPRRRHLVAAMVVFIAVISGSGAHAQSAPPLVDPAWLIGQLQDPQLVVFDLRRKAAYDSGHLIGAINVDLTKVAFRQRTSDGEPQLLDTEEFSARLGAFGVRAQDKIVLMSAGESWLDVAGATELFWLLKRVGHTQVAILNGGFRRLAETAGVRLDSQSNVRLKTVYTPGTPLVRGYQSADLIDLPPSVLRVDARLRAQFLGINKVAGVARYGTIPGAKNLPGNWVTYDAAGQLRTADDLRRVLDLAGIPQHGQMVVFGNTAAAGSLVWFALRVILGNREVRLFDRGFGEWAADPARPVVLHLGSTETQRP